jgi:hypothetical protein
MTYNIKPSIQKLSEEDIRTALNSRDEDNLVVVEFGMMLRDLVAECRRLKNEGGNVQAFLSKAPSCAMEKIALELIAEMAAAGKPLDGEPPKGA